MSLLFGSRFALRRIWCEWNFSTLKLALILSSPYDIVSLSFKASLDNARCVANIFAIFRPLSPLFANHRNHKRFDWDRMRAPENEWLSDESDELLAARFIRCVNDTEQRWNQIYCDFRSRIAWICIEIYWVYVCWRRRKPLTVGKGWNLQIGEWEQQQQKHRNNVEEN